MGSYAEVTKCRASIPDHCRNETHEVREVDPVGSYVWHRRISFESLYSHTQQPINATVIAECIKIISGEQINLKTLHPRP